MKSDSPGVTRALVAKAGHVLHGCVYINFLTGSRTLALFLSRMHTLYRLKRVMFAVHVTGLSASYVFLNI